MTKKFKTPEGIEICIYVNEGKNKYHSTEGPAIRYPKKMKREDEYFIYGIRYSKERWTELKSDSKVSNLPSGLFHS